MGQKGYECHDKSKKAKTFLVQRGNFFCGVIQNRYGKLHNQYLREFEFILKDVLAKEAGPGDIQNKLKNIQKIKKTCDTIFLLY